MAGVSIPAAELGVAPVRPQPAPVEPGRTVATVESIASAEAARRAADTVRTAQRARTAESARKAVEASARPEAKPDKVELAAKPEKKSAKAERTAKVDKDLPVDPKKAAADRKAVAAKKLADAKKAAEARKAADEEKLAKADPPRIWVQVAGGANENDLPKAWAASKTKAAALKGKTAYSTPLRATNRVVTGPFKTDTEARAFVNTLAKQGIAAFPFTSEKGQKMKKLAER